MFLKLIIYVFDVKLMKDCYGGKVYLGFYIYDILVDYNKVY